ncbi:hypothetical protein [Methylomarinum vadi]|uniref:hypothetical protein n=1 Tax=Methylomarinum vadi TaxID=438855 RepID=UPI0004DFCD47|nr:hypothetical protein [Methylomarinum vadi]
MGTIKWQFTPFNLEKWNSFKEREAKSKFVAMPHPSAMISDGALQRASGNIRKHLKTINEGMIEKWIYKKGDRDH